MAWTAGDGPPNPCDAGRSVQEQLRVGLSPGFGPLGT